jgi:hypothetical protein
VYTILALKTSWRSTMLDACWYQVAWLRAIGLQLAIHILILSAQSITPKRTFEDAFGRKLYLPRPLRFGLFYHLSLSVSVPEIGQIRKHKLTKRQLIPTILRATGISAPMRKKDPEGCEPSCRPGVVLERALARRMEAVRRNPTGRIAWSGVSLMRQSATRAHPRHGDLEFPPRPTPKRAD